MSYALASLVTAAIAAPHLLRLDSASPVLAASIWLAALALRALTALAAALLVLLYIPTTDVFRAVTHWCWHAVIPLITAHLPFSGHALADAALIAPGIVLVGSSVAVVAGLWRAARRVALLLRRAAMGPGPSNSVVLADGAVLVACAGLRRPIVVVSAGALVSLDDDELAASLAHEHGHIERRHRYLLVLAELLRAFARFLPGSRSAAREFVFHLERDADRYAVARDHDPLALASAICKAAIGPSLGPSMSALGGSGVVARRIRLLMTGEGAGPPASHASGLRALAAAMTTLVLISAATLPASAHAGYHAVGATQLPRHCDR